MACYLNRTTQNVLDTMGLRPSLGCADVAAVVGALTAPFSLTAGRRLQLAAERGGTTGFLLQPGPAVGAATAAVTRWRVGSLPSVAPAWPGLGRPRWSLTLDRCRQGLPRSWIVEWCDETRDFRLADPTGVPALLIGKRGEASLVAGTGPDGRLRCEIQ